MNVIEVIHIESDQRVSIQPDLSTAHKSVGSWAIDQGVYKFVPADLNVVWLLWRDSQDYDEGNELLAVFSDRELAADLLDQFKSESYRYSISCVEINDTAAAMAYLPRDYRG